MLLQALREQVLEANLELVRRGLVLYTFGNASGIDRGQGLIAIKPSGVPYERMRASDLPIVNLDGRVVDGEMRPSSDLATHLVLYRSFSAIGGVVHTHSRCATAWAQARKPIPCLGTTHADYFHGEVPVTLELTEEQIRSEYEARIGDVIVSTLAGRDALEMPAVLAAGHAPFCWGRDAAEAAHHAVLLEEVSALALAALSINPGATPIPRAMLDLHFYRKHGAGASYGQRGS
ncbi:MAG: L-ribulose-5-phosphate 4-epimerase AraD [Acidobacteriales bacterium]|nr:MAG: L-ribulose-5-phosphate 4-epimerase AraD [Terriglobales bacterium]